MIEEAGRPPEHTELGIWITPEGWWIDGTAKGLLKTVTGAATLAASLAHREAATKGIEFSPEFVVNKVEALCSVACDTMPPKRLAARPACKADVVLIYNKDGCTIAVGKIVMLEDHERAAKLALSLALIACLTRRVVVDREEFTDWCTSTAAFTYFNKETDYADPFGS
jgi:hypothetical protein